ncbi:MAG: sialidase family protein [Pirellula sp.]
MIFNQLIVLSLSVLTIFVIPLHADEPFVIYKGESPNIPKQPQACVSPDGIVHLTFGVGGKILYCNNSDGFFATPVNAFEVPNLSLGMRRGPRIASTNKSIVISAIGGVQGKGKDGDLQAYRSKDQGKTWLGPIKVNDIEASAREGLHAMTVSENGVYWCVWIDLRSDKSELYASRSEDEGRTWRKNQLVYRSPDGSVCECCHPSIVTFGESIHILFRNSLDGNRDMYLISSNDGGKSFGGAKRLGIESWQLNGCPMDGGMLAVKPSGEVITVWRRKGAIFTTEKPSKLESSLGGGEQAWIAANADETYVVWLASRDGDLLFAKSGSKVEKIANASRDPVIVAGTRNSSGAHLFWEQRTDIGTSIVWKNVR